MTQHNSKQQALIQAAENLGIETIDFQKDWIQDVVQYQKAGKSEFISEGMEFGSNTNHSEMICEDRHIGKQLLAKAHINVPSGLVFKLDQEDFDRAKLEHVLEGFIKEGKSYVCRPAYGTGRYAQKKNIRSIETLETHLEQYVEDYATWLIEEDYSGTPLRLLVIGSEICAAEIREEFGLVGDGESSLEELLDAHNAQANEADQIQINAETRQWMRDQDVYLSAIVPEGQLVVLRGGEEGGPAINVMSDLHQVYHEWAKKIAAILNRPVFAIDIVCEKPSAEPSSSALVIDIDGNPIWDQFLSNFGSNELAEKILGAIFN